LSRTSHYTPIRVNRLSRRRDRTAPQTTVEWDTPRKTNRGGLGRAPAFLQLATSKTAIGRHRTDLRPAFGGQSPQIDSATQGYPMLAPAAGPTSPRGPAVVHNSDEEISSAGRERESRSISGLDSCGRLRCGITLAPPFERGQLNAQRNESSPGPRPPAPDFANLIMVDLLQKT